MMPILASSGLLWGELISDYFDHHTLLYFHGFLLFLVILGLSLAYRYSLGNLEDEVFPDTQVSIKNIMQTAVESLLNLIRSVIPHHAEDYLPLLGTIFIFIFIGNLMGLIPGLLPPTESLSGNLAVGLTVFVLYNYYGVRRTGLKKYMSHFMGPLLWMAPMFFVIELLSHLVRPVSLSLRLFGNINGDHKVLEAFTGLVPLFIPVIFMAFGIFVSFIQAFVFTLLSTIYVGLAVETHDH